MRTVNKIIATAAIPLALAVTSPAPAQAHPFIAWWIVSGVAGGVVGYFIGVNGAAAAQTAPIGAGCHWDRAQINGAWHRVQVCD